LIEFIQGQLQIKGNNYIVVQVGGIAYRFFISSLTLSKLPSVKEELTIFTYLHVREDELSLYGFLSAEEKEMFVTLLQVSGIGPKLALAILSHLSSFELRRAIMLGDIQTLVQIRGVGKKTAGRIVLELKDKLQKEALPEEYADLSIGIEDKNTDARSEAVSALLALGYSVAEAQRAVPVIKDGQDYAVQDLLRLALKNIVK